MLMNFYPDHTVVRFYRQKWLQRRFARHLCCALCLILGSQASVCAGLYQTYQKSQSLKSQVSNTFKTYQNLRVSLQDSDDRLFDQSFYHESDRVFGACKKMFQLLSQSHFASMKLESLSYKKDMWTMLFLVRSLSHIPVLQNVLQTAFPDQSWSLKDCRYVKTKQYYKVTVGD